MEKVKQINIKSRSYYFCDDMINIKNFQNVIDIWHFTTLRNTVHCVNNTFFGKFQLLFKILPTYVSTLSATIKL